MRLGKLTQAKPVQEIRHCTTCHQSRVTAMSDMRNLERLGDERIQVNGRETKEADTAGGVRTKQVSPSTVTH